MTFIFLAAGIPVFIWAARERTSGQNKRCFTAPELLAAILIVIIAIIAAASAINGTIDL